MTDNSNNKDQTDSGGPSSSHKTNCNEAIKPWDILADHLGTKVNENFVLSLDKSTDFISDKVKENCKVLQFSPNWNFEELVTALEELDLRVYPNLLVVIIRSLNLGFNIDSQFIEEPPIKKSKKCNKKVEEVLSKLNSKFDSSHQLILQLTSTDENEARFYVKDKSGQFIEIDKMDVNVENVDNFSTFLCSLLGGRIQSIEQLTAGWKELIKSTLILNFLKIFEDLFNKLILDVTKSGTKIDLLTILDAPVEHEGRVLTVHAQQYLSQLIDESQSTKAKKDEDGSSNDELMTESDRKSILQNKASTSLLLTAIEHKNTEVIDYLITYWTHLIQELPFDHQVRASTLAFRSDQLDVLCDFLDIADFPFPENYEFDDEQEHKRLRRITLERMALSNAIKKENFEKLNGFINSHISLKNVYSIDNETALTQAIEAKKFGVFYFLKSFGFQSKNYEDILNKLNKEDRKKATHEAVKQRKANVNQALVNVHKSVLLLATRSLIHNRRIGKEKEEENRQKIINWLQDIHKVAPEMLEVAASCEYLKIIFDFESNTVDSMNLGTSKNLGVTRRASKWIFIGAKLSDQKQEQRIKGVLAHEICHYVMCLVYNNKYFPYFEDAKDIRDKFDGIVKTIDQWSAYESKRPDDECNGNISTVFTHYDSKKRHLELIVRPVQNQVEFNNKSAYLEEKYKVLYGFWEEHVLPDLKNYCKRNPKIIKLNKLVELLPRILNKEITTKSGKDIETVINNKLAVVTTNLPTLLFLDIVKELKKKCGILFDSQNFFTEPQRLNNQEIWNDFEEICKEAEKLNIFVDCTKGVPGYLEGIFVNKELNFTFVVSNDTQREELIKIFDSRKMKNFLKMESNYNWNDLTEDGQKLLLKTKINFQNNSEIALKELFVTKSDSISEAINHETDTIPDLYKVVDDEILNLIFDEKMLTINSITELDQSEKNFKLLSMPRKFLEKIKCQTSQEHSEFVPIKSSETVQKSIILQKELLLKVKNHPYILISDKAGNGKSWAMKNFSRILRERNPKSWVTYVDLKQFIKEFKAQKVMPEFSSFIAEKILKTEQKFESKIFQKLYKDGKVFILFDGFDEIAPDCAEFVSNLAQSFQSNGGNQLWIATRDYFEVDLQQKLEIYVAYGLDEMNVDDGIRMIAKNWILMDLGVDKEVISEDEFYKHVESSPHFNEYDEKARQIVRKIRVDWNRSVGMPQMYKMIADGFKNENQILDLKKSKFYEQFIKVLYRRWSREKGEIREEASIECQNKKVQFWEFHLYHAILSMFPKLGEILFPGYSGKDWPIEEIIACGILSIRDGEVYFLHETLREYFVADALVKALKSDIINDKILEVLVDVLTLEQYNIIRMFLNDLADSHILNKILPKITKFTEKFYEMENFVEFFEENLENLVDFVLMILKEGDLNKVNKLLKKDSKKIAERTENSKLLFKFFDFLCHFLTCNELKDLLEIEEIFNEIIRNFNGITIFADFVLKIEGMAGYDFVQQELRRAIREEWMQKDYFRFFFKVRDPKAFKFRKFLEMLHKFLPPNEIMEFLKKKYSHWETTLLSDCISNNNKEMLKIMWTEMENYFGSQKMSQDFKALVTLQDSCKRNILHKIPKSENLEFHNTFWKLLQNTVKNHDEISDLVLQKDYWGNNFVHDLIIYNKSPEVIEWTFNKLKENFTDSQFQEFIQSRGGDNRGLLHSAAYGRQNIENFKFFWNFFRSLFKFEQRFWEIIEKADRNGRNNFNYAVRKSAVEVFIFFIDEYEKKYSKKEINEMLRNFDKKNQNLLHYAARKSSSDTLNALWINCQKYLNSEEILEIVMQVGGEDSVNFLFYIKSGEVFEFAIKELEKIIGQDEIRGLLCCMSKTNRNILQNVVADYQNSLHLNETLWKIIRKYFVNSDIKKFIKNVDEDGNNLLHLAVSDSFIPKKIVEFTWSEIQMFLNRDEQIEYLKSKGKNNQNLIESSRNNEIRQWMKNIIEEYKVV